MKPFDKIKTFVKKHKKGLIVTGVVLIGGVAYLVGVRRTVNTLTKDCKTMFPEAGDIIAMHNKACAGPDGWVYIHQGAGITEIEQLGELGKAAVAFNNNIVDHEVVGAVIYTKKK